MSRIHTMLTTIFRGARSALLPALLLTLAGSLVTPATADAQRRRRAAAAQEDEDGPSRPQVTLSDLDTVAPKLQSANLDEVREGIDLLVIIDSPEVIPHLATFLRGGAPDALTNRALEALRGLGHASAIDVLTEFTNHRRVAARRRAYQALAAIEDERVAPLLERGLRDSDRTVRGAAALALGNIGARGSIEILFRAFERNVIEAAIALGKIAPANALERYHGFLGREPLGVMLSGYEHFLRRDDIPFEAKKDIIERLGEVAGVMVRRFLGEYFATLPERTRNREIRELKELLQETIRRIPEEAAGTTIRGGAATPAPAAPEGGAQ